MNWSDVSYLRLTLAIALSLVVAGPVKAEERTLVLATGPAAGQYYPVGGALCRVVNQTRANHGVRCLVESTSGSEENLRRLGEGGVDLAIVQSDWQFYAPRTLETAEQGSAESDGGPVRAVLSLQAQPLTLLVGAESGISTLSDLHAKRVNLAPEGSGLRAATLSLLGAMGWGEEDFEISSAPVGPALVEALCRGEVDAVILPLSHPAYLVESATRQCSAKLIPLDAPVIELVERAWPFYGRADIPGGIYAGHSVPTPSVGMRATLVAATALSDDLVYNLVESLFGQIEGLRAQHPLLSSLDPEAMVGRGNTIDLHDGAARYYEQQGWSLPTQNNE